MTSRASPALALLLALCETACDGVSHRGRSPWTPTAVLGGDVVAIVGRRPISRSDVVEHARATATSTRDALTALENSSLLAAEARRRGLETTDAHELRRQALAQLILRGIERQLTLDGLSPDDVAARIARIGTSMARPERRQASHLLVRVAPNAPPASRAAAAAVAARALDLLARAVDPASALGPTSQQLMLGDAHVEISVEDLPLVDRNVQYERPFVDALFGAASIGVIDHVVSTSFGEHVIVVSRIDPPIVPDGAAVRERAEREALNSVRRSAVDALLESLGERSRITRHEAAIARRLGSDELFERLR